MKFKYGNFFGLVFRLLFTVIMIAVLYSYAMFQGGFISWFLFYSVVTIVVLGMLSTVTPLKFVQVSRTIRDQQLKNGDHTTVEVTVKKTGPFPLLYLGVMDEVPKGVRIESHPGAFFFMLFAKEKTYSYVVKGVKRGLYPFDHFTLETGDMIGFFRRKAIKKVTNELGVYPNLATLPDSFLQRKMQPHHLAKLEGGGQAKSSYDETMDFSNVREYVAGDRLSSIDWKVTARQNKLATKAFDREESRGYTVMFDTRSEDNGAFESAIEWTAGLVDHSFEHGILMNFAAVGETSYTTKKGQDHAHLRHVMNILVKITPTAGMKRAPIQKGFQFLNTVIYVTPTLHDGAVADVRKLKQLGQHVIVFTEITKQRRSNSNRCVFRQ
ncbi:hypothetical protein JCM19037_1911 [Geomicrobium sp. JCM 19037]|uniref:DUF58 domain-containing protein n=1 Tax=Geomicrobium sp. JCM 19037 TaxID=1460634 RepID=UPI00045F1372|nr:DUF58 domain-containing protein [Geomicrobium sp. JCM 19037]GAK03575.1 hypothetical protein JCM19037_1911 [Geomicrobium sp. JCM 19037]